jgi:hypothetical protein
MVEGDSRALRRKMRPYFENSDDERDYDENEAEIFQRQYQVDEDYRAQMMENEAEILEQDIKWDELNGYSWRRHEAPLEVESFVTRKSQKEPERIKVLGSEDKVPAKSSSSPSDASRWDNLNAGLGPLIRLAAFRVFSLCVTKWQTSTAD